MIETMNWYQAEVSIREGVRRMTGLRSTSINKNNHDRI